MRLGCILIGLGLHYGIATSFSANGDPQNPKPFLACLRRDLRDSTDELVASRDLPCRSYVFVCVPRTSRCRRAVVGERGPWGKKKNGSFRSLLDLSPALRRSLKHNGYERVLYTAVK